MNIPFQSGALSEDVGVQGFRGLIIQGVSIIQDLQDPAQGVSII